MKTKIGCFMLWFLILAHVNAHGQIPPSITDEPILRINPEKHAGWIKRIGADNLCHYLVTAGRDDKTARLWEIPQNIKDAPKLIRKFRHPIGFQNFGKVYAAAISPDAKLIAVGGWDVGYLSPGQGKNYVYIFDSGTGDLLKRVGGFDDVIHTLVFSPNGKFLVAGLHDTQGIGIWETDSWRPIKHNGSYRGSVYGAVFDSQGRFYTVSYGAYNEGLPTAGSIHIYTQIGRTFQLLKEKPSVSGKYPYSIAINPAENRLAVGYTDVSNVDIYDAESLEVLQGPEVARAASQSVSVAVTWSADGKELYGTLSPQNDFGPKLLQSWDSKYKVSMPGMLLPLPPLGSTVQLLPCGSRILIAANEGFGFFDPNSKELNWVDGSNPIFTVNKGDERRRIRLSTDGSQVAFAFNHGGENRFIFDVVKQTLHGASLEEIEQLHPPDTRSLPISDWEFSLSPKLGGKPLAIEPYERAMSLAIHPMREQFILGTEWRLHAYNLRGKELWCEDISCDHALSVESAIIDLNVSRDGRLVVSAESDGTIRWRSISNGQVLLSLFVDKESMKWVAWTPKGYFMASVGGEDLIGWHVNRGLELKADFYTAHVFRDKFLRPDIVRLVLQTGDESLAIAEANKNKAVPLPAEMFVVKTGAPVVDILSPKFNSTVSGETVDIEYVVRSPNHEVTKFEAMIDGSVVYQGPFNSDQLNTRQTLKLPFPKGGEVVTLNAYAEKLNNPSSVVVRGGDSIGKQSKIKPKLFALVIGIRNYKAKPLKWADKDAEDFKNILEGQRTVPDGLYRDIDVRSLINEDATKPRVLQELRRLRDDMRIEANKNKGNPSDIAIVFYSGHGAVDGNNKFYLTPPPPQDGARIEDYAISEWDLRSHIENFPGLKFLMIDACRAGSILGEMSTFNFTSFVNYLADVTFVYSSTGAKDFSFECDTHGCFTQALIDGINGEADKYPPRNLVSTYEIEAYLASQVPILRKAEDQLPMMHKSHAFKHINLFQIPGLKVDGDRPHN